MRWELASLGAGSSNRVSSFVCDPNPLVAAGAEQRREGEGRGGEGTEEEGRGRKRRGGEGEAKLESWAEQSRVEQNQGTRQRQVRMHAAKLLVAHTTRDSRTKVPPLPPRKLHLERRCTKDVLVVKHPAVAAPDDQHSPVRGAQEEVRVSKALVNPL